MRWRRSFLALGGLEHDAELGGLGPMRFDAERAGELAIDRGWSGERSAGTAFGGAVRAGGDGVASARERTPIQERGSEPEAVRRARPQAMECPPFRRTVPAMV